MIESGFEIYTTTPAIAKEDVSAADGNSTKVEFLTPYYVYRYEGYGVWVFRNSLRADDEWKIAIEGEQDFHDSCGRLLKTCIIDSEKLMVSFLTDVLYETVISEREYLTKFGVGSLYG